MTAGDEAYRQSYKAGYDAGTAAERLSWEKREANWREVGKNLLGHITKVGWPHVGTAFWLGQLQDLLEEGGPSSRPFTEKHDSSKGGQ